MGSHNCEKVKEKTKNTPRPSGMVWLCFDCFRKNDLALMQKDGGKTSQLEDILEEEEEEEEEKDENSPRRNRSPHGAEPERLCVKPTRSVNVDMVSLASGLLRESRVHTNIHPDVSDGANMGTTSALGALRFQNAHTITQNSAKTPF